MLHSCFNDYYQIINQVRGQVLEHRFRFEIASPCLKWKSNKAVLVLHFYVCRCSNTSVSTKRWPSSNKRWLDVQKMSLVLLSCFSSFSWLTLSGATWFLVHRSKVSVLMLTACKDILISLLDRAMSLICWHRVWSKMSRLILTIWTPRITNIAHNFWVWLPVSGYCQVPGTCGQWNFNLVKNSKEWMHLKEHRKTNERLEDLKSIFRLPGSFKDLFALS